MLMVPLSGRAPLLSGCPVPWPPSDDYTLDLSDLVFATPFDLVGLAALVHATPPSRNVVVVPPRRPGVANYLQRMDLFLVLDGRVRVVPALAPELPRDPGPALVELRRLDRPDEIDDDASMLWPRLRAKLPYEVCRGLFEILGELVDNAATHGRGAAGTFVAAQYYSGATSGMPEGFWIGVADGGIGIRDHLRHNPRYFAVESDIAAIRFSVQPWVTGTTDRRGWGLRTVLEKAGALAPGRVVIRSGIGEGAFSVNRGGATTAHYRTHEPGIPGTWVHVLAGHRG